MFYTEAQNPHLIRDGSAGGWGAGGDQYLGAAHLRRRVPDGAVYWRFAFDVYSAALNATGNVWLDNVRVNDVDIVVKGVSPGTLVVSASWYGRFAYA
jgi:hypothetical protein